MPTGYTAQVADHEDLPLADFVLSCARAMGALVHMRDDDMDAPIRKREAHDHAKRELAAAQGRLACLELMTTATADKRALEDWEKAVAQHKECVAKNTETRRRYRAMIAKVRAWVPPTDEHAGLKTFMLEQLTSSIDFDCTPVWRVPQRKTGEAWLAEQKESAAQDITYYAEQAAKEETRCAEANEWIDALLRSLGR